ncbi:MAG: IS110 family transposase [Planctomycetes bacterium]|nr:IS110 family transposase [Planctomycetota bacterium]
MAVVIAATIDVPPRRFKNRKQMDACAGLTSKQFESGTRSQQGGISGGAGDG